MINLIPPKGHVSLKHEYVLRVVSVYALILTGVFVAGTLLTIPTYVLVSSQLNAVRSDNAHIEVITETYNDALAKIQSANTLMAQLRGTVSRRETSNIIEEVIRVAPGGITLHTFHVSREEGDIKSINVQGLAKTRNALATLKNELEASPLFLTATIPISDLARESDLPFVVTVALEGSDVSK
jgi:Tfp pilus assembly protein PilN